MSVRGRRQSTSDPHDWRPDVRNKQPVLKCSRCPIVWWPDRREPRTTCTGAVTVADAQRAVRALMVGNAEETT